MTKDITHTAVPRTATRAQHLGVSKPTRESQLVNPNDDFDLVTGHATTDAFEYGDFDLLPGKRVPVLITLPDGSNSDAGLEARSPLFSQDERLELPLINGFSTFVDEDKLDQLASTLPAGTNLFLNKEIRYSGAPKLLSDIEVESLPGRVERLPNIEKVHARGFTGKGQKIVVIDSGVTNHPDLKDKVVKWVDFSLAKKKTMADDYGHGTHVASVAAGTGAQSDGEIKGVAPDAEIVGLRITRVAEAIKALQWCVENKDELGLKVINMSLGEVARKGYKFDPWAQAVEKAVDAGLVVCVAAGNEGPDPTTVSTPGISPKAITVGAYDSKGTPQLDDDTVWKNSSQGPTIDEIASKPDVLGLGVSVFGALAKGAQLDSDSLAHRGKDYFALSGTSQATPMISGLAVILLQANPDLDAAGIKEILKQASAAAPPHPATGRPTADGAGLVDAEKALDLALASRSKSAQVA